MSEKTDYAVVAVPSKRLAELLESERKVRTLKAGADCGDFNRRSHSKEGVSDTDLFFDIANEEIERQRKHLRANE